MTSPSALRVARTLDAASAHDTVDGFNSVNAIPEKARRGRQFAARTEGIASDYRAVLLVFQRSGQRLGETQ